MNKVTSRNLLIEMDVFGSVLDWANKLLFGEAQNPDLPAPIDQTVAPHNIHTIQYDITLKPIEAIPDIVSIDDITDPDLTPILDELLNSFMSDTDNPTNYANPDVRSSQNFSSTIIAKDDGNSFVQVVEDATGKTVELWHEIVAETTTTAGKILNTTKSTPTTANPAAEANYINDYVIAALVLTLVIITCIGVLLWCRSNRLKTEKRNKYPVMTAVNNEYMNPQALKNNEKLKNIP